MASSAIRWSIASECREQEEARAQARDSGVLPGALSLLVLRGLVARLSHLPKSETECDVTPPGDAKPRKSVDDDRAEKWAAIGS
jgi:hypothetical protein